MNTQDMRIHFIGSGDAVSSGGRYQNCILVHSASERFLIDCGASSLTALKAASIDLNDISTILISDLQGDHFGGIPFFLLDAQLVSQRSTPLSVVGPPGLFEYVRLAMELLFPGSSQLCQQFELRFIELSPCQCAALGTITVAGFPVLPGSEDPLYALRVECAGRTIVYTGSAEWTHSLIEVALDADVCICEASSFAVATQFQHNYQALRLCYHEFLCKRIVLTHMNQELLSRLDRIGLETAWDGKVISV
jgi:ribonuclease BN (tRNA processing enzyme)